MLHVLPYLKAVALALFLLITPGVFSQVAIKGHVADANTGEPLVGATVTLKESGQSTTVQLDGKFSLTRVRTGKHTLTISHQGYFSSVNNLLLFADSIASVDISLRPESQELYSVIVTGAGRSEAGARNLERRADPLLNVLSAQTIQLMPDITVANIMQRVSGVTIERNSSGEARYPIIRGMEKRYINTLVNGIKIPSPDNRSRFIPLDLFPAELLERLEVSKSLVPSMEGDAIGGTINLVMKDAPATRLFQVNASLGYNNIFGSQDFLKFNPNTIQKSSPAESKGQNYQASPSDFPAGPLNYSSRSHPLNGVLGATYGNRFGKDKKLGLLLSASYQDVLSGTQSTFFLPNAQPSLNNRPQFVDLYSRQYSTQNRRLGLNGKLDYKFNEHNKISWFNTYVQLNMLQTRQTSDTIVLNTLLDETFRTTWQYQSIYNSTLQGSHQLDHLFTIDWSAGYSIASNHLPDQATFGHEFPVLIDPRSGAVTRGTPDYLLGMSRNWLHNSDKDLSAYLNITRQANVFNTKLELKAGGMVRNKKRNNFYNAYSLNPLLPAGSSLQQYTNINQAVYTFKGSNATPGLNGNNYDFNEEVWAAYIQGKWQLTEKLELLGGVRTESTHQHYTTELGPEVDARSGRIWYTDLLPSAQAKWALSKHQSLRLSYYKALARPQFAELIPDGPDNYETFKERGNPAGLNHSVADNFDLRYEIFPAIADQILVGAFYKKIKDPIEFTAVKVGVTSQNLIPKNIGTAVNYGLEAVFTKYFGQFGISANYTYTKSKVTNDSMLYYYRNEAGSLTSKYVSETRPLQGQSNHVGNIALLFKNNKIGLDAQLAFVYTGERISLVSPYAGLHYWQQPTTGLDVSFEKRIVRRFSFYGKVNNLTNSPVVVSLHLPYNNYISSGGGRPLSLQSDPGSKIIVQKDYIRTSFLFGFRFKL